jgi:transposase
MTDHTPTSKVSRLEVVSTGARRRWTLEEKQRIVAESYGGPRLVSVTARRNGLSTSQLFTWRRLARNGRLSGDAVPALVPVEITSKEVLVRPLPAQRPIGWGLGPVNAAAGYHPRCCYIALQFHQESFAEVLRLTVELTPAGSRSRPRISGQNPSVDFRFWHL